VIADARWVKVFLVANGTCISKGDCQHYSSPKFHPTLKNYLVNSTYEEISLYDLSKMKADLEDCLIQYVPSENPEEEEFPPLDSYPFCFPSDGKRIFFGFGRKIVSFHFKMEKPFFDRILRNLDESNFSDCIIRLEE
jgi:hypothetical protein